MSIERVQVDEVPSPSEHQRSADSSVLRVQGLIKCFGESRAVDNLSFQVRAGECFGLLGPNGAGKSTTLKLLLGLTEADEGTIDLLGYPIPSAAPAARRHVGVVPQNDALDPEFTVAENLLVFGRYFGIPRSQLQLKLPGLLEFAGLSARADSRIQELSGGMKRRLTLARALVNDPQVLFLDEPTTGLDPQARHLIWDRLRRLLSLGKTILLTTHFMEEAERLCSRIQIMDRGKMIAVDSPQAMIQREIEPTVVEVTGERALVWGRDMAQHGLAARVEVVGETVFAYCHDAGALIGEIRSKPGLRYLQRPANLEDVFLKLTGRDLRD